MASQRALQEELEDVEAAQLSVSCPICLREFKAGVILKRVERCRHEFHPLCILRWLETHSSCPVCRHQLSRSGGEPAAPSAEEHITSLFDWSDGDDHNVYL